MKFDGIVEDVSIRLSLPKEVVALYLKAYLEAQRRSVAGFQPVRVFGHMSLNLHNYILKHKQVGEDLPMPQGFTALLNEDRKAYNHHRKAGTYLKVGDTVGVVIRQIGEDDIIWQPLCTLNEYKFGKHERLMATFCKGDVVRLGKDGYKRTGTVKAWFNKAKHKIDPPMTARGFLKTLKRTWIE